MRRCDLARGRREWVALLLALLAKQEGHGAGFAALGTLQWQRVPATHAFGLHGGGQARGMGGVELVRAGIGIRLVRLEIGGPAGVRARWLASWCYGRSTGGVRMSKEREWRCRCRCRCSARCQTQTSVTRLAVACPGPAQLLGGAGVGVAQHLAWSATRQQRGEAWTAHQWPARDLT